MAVLDGSKLRAIRKSQNRTQADIAEAANITERYVRDLEACKKFRPSAEILHGIASFLGVKMEDLMTTQKKDT